MKSMKKLICWSAVITACTHFANKAISHLALVKRLLPVNNGSYYETRFGSVFYTKTGSGSPLLLIHDLQPESCGYEWNMLMTQLSESHTVYTVDLPGCGRSEKQNLMYTSYLYVQFLEKFCKDVIGEPAIIAATGTSCTFTLLAAAEKTDIASRIVLVNPATFAAQIIKPEKKASLYCKLVSLPVFGSCLYNQAFSLLRMREKFATQYFYKRTPAMESCVNAYYEAAHTGSRDGRFLYASILAGCMDLPVAHVLPKISVPVTLIAGEEKPGALVTADAYKQLQPDITIKTIPGTRHLPQLECPDVLSQMLL